MNTVSKYSTGDNSKSADTLAWERLHKNALYVSSLAHSCLNCEHWGDDEDACLLFKVRPPAQVIVFSCEAWDDRIPF